MNKWIETYMEEKNLKPNELFRLDSQTFKGEYYFDEYGTLYRKTRGGYENPSMEIWGRLMNGIKIEKVKPKGRYIPKPFDTYYYVSDLGNILGTTNNEYESDSYIFKHSLVFETKEEAEDYKWFLEQVDKYKKEFVKDISNHCFQFNYNMGSINIDSWKSMRYQEVTYFGSYGNIEEFRNVVGDERIKKYFFGVFE